MRPQVGLLPLGRDPRSGLFEFAHLRSGAPAVRGDDGELQVDADSGLVFVLLPPDAFVMGAQAKDEDGLRYQAAAQTSENPPHRVELPASFLSKYEISKAQWRRLDRGRDPSGIPSAARRSPSSARSSR